MKAPDKSLREFFRDHSFNFREVQFFTAYSGSPDHRGFQGNHNAKVKLRQGMTGKQFRHAVKAARRL